MGDFYIARGPRRSDRLTERPFRKTGFESGTTPYGEYARSKWNYKGYWYINESFPEAEDAVDAIRSMRARDSQIARLCVQDEEGYIVWSETSGWATVHETVEFVAAFIPPQEVPTMGVPTQTLNVEVAQVITTLEQRAADEAQKRAEANAAAQKRRQAAQDALASLDPDEVLNLVLRWYSDLDNIVQMVDEAKESGRLKSKELTETPVESAIAKYLRVLTMSTDKTIEVTPSDSLYSLL